MWEYNNLFKHFVTRACKFRKKIIFTQARTYNILENKNTFSSRVFDVSLSMKTFTFVRDKSRNDTSNYCLPF